MISLNFTVKNQRLYRGENFPRLVSKSKGVLECHFIFGDEWTNFNPAAIFHNYDRSIEEVVEIQNSVCQVPDSVTDGKYFFMKLVGAKSPTEYTYTNGIIIDQEG